MTILLTKLHGTGNDFLVTAALDGTAPPDAAAVRALCDRHRGIGADGLITLLPGTDGADCAMVLRNADGSEAEMSGNGIRCLAWVAAREGIARGEQLVVDTAAGRRTVELERSADSAVRGATVDMGPVTFEPAGIPLDAASAFDLQAIVDGATYHGDAAGMGNPHLILLVDDVGAVPVARHGPLLEVDPRFPHRVNVGFAAPTDAGALDLRVWERGVGETLSCGTGACAAAAVARRRALVGDRVVVHVPGGDLIVVLGATVRLGGPVTHVFDVEIDAPWLAGGDR